MPPLPGRLRRFEGILVFASYLAVFAALCAPWLRVVSSAIPVAGAPGDTRLVAWILWWVAHSLAGDPTRLFDAPINHPVAGQLSGSEHFLTAQVVFFPVYAATGNIVLGLNAALFLAHPLTALAMNRLLRALGFGALVAWTVALGFALGAVQVPAEVHNLQVFGVFPAVVALALRRLRERPDALRAFAFATCWLLAIFASYYTAAIVLVVFLVWATAELARPLPKRGRFLWTAAGIVGVAMLLLALFSLPYLSRNEVGAPSAEIDRQLRFGAALNALALLQRPAHFLGAVSLGLAAIGIAGLFDRRWRWVSCVGLLLVAASVLIIGGGAEVLDAAGSGTLANLLTLPLRFFRNVVRLAVIASFGLALLGAVALQIARRHLPRPLGIALVAVVALAIVYERGPKLLPSALDSPAALSRDAPIYVRVKHITSRRGRGPLLELPLGFEGFPLQADAMLGSVWHALPLVTGFTGYHPRQRRLIDETIQRLPSPQALQDLVDMTQLRWILLRPGEFWISPATRARFARSLLRIPGVGPEHRIGKWSLIPIEGKIVHRDWFEAIARGTGPDRSLLGTPLGDVAAERTASRIELRGDATAAIHAEVGTALAVPLRVVNRGETTWPVVRDGKEALPGGMSVRARWHPLDPRPGAGPSDVRAFPLPRDLLPGEAAAFAVHVPPPAVPGTYALELSLEQVERAVLPRDANPPLALRVAVGGAKATAPPAANEGAVTSPDPTSPATPLPGEKRAVPSPGAA
jgi:hypothetical protein